MKAVPCRLDRGSGPWRAPPPAETAQTDVVAARRFVRRLASAAREITLRRPPPTTIYELRRTDGRRSSAAGGGRSLISGGGGECLRWRWLGRRSIRTCVPCTGAEFAALFTLDFRTNCRQRTRVNDDTLASLFHEQFTLYFPLAYFAAACVAQWLRS